MDKAENRFVRDTYWLTSWAYLPRPFSTLWWSSSKVMSPERKQTRQDLKARNIINYAIYIMQMFMTTLIVYYYVETLTQ